MTDKIVKVYRHWQYNGGEGYDGWFFSKIYGCSDGKILVWDNGECSAYDDAPQFIWIDPTEVYRDICSKTDHCVCEPVDAAEVAAERWCKNDR